MRVHHSNSGFTIIELLVSIATLGILFGLGLEAMKEYKDRAYYSVSEKALHDARTALEAGKIDEEKWGSSVISFYMTGEGVVTSATGKQLVPGLVLPGRSRVFVRHDPSCASNTWCLEDYVMVRNCKSSEYTYWYKYSNGQEYTQKHIAAGWSC